jgi:hypothetical protein
MKALTVVLMAVFMACPAFAGGPPAWWDEELADVSAVTGSPTGALATAREEEKRTSAIRWRLSPDANYLGLKVKGRVSSLLFVDDNAALLAVIQRQTKRKTGDTYLLNIDTSSRETERLVTLPRSAAGMTWWPGARHVLVACENEIRSFTMPGFRSGPLYQLPGGNLAMAHHSGPVFLVSRTTDLVLVNLEDPQGEDQIPVRKRFAIASPLLAVTVSSGPTRLYGITMAGERVEQALEALDLSAASLPPAPIVIEEPVVQEPDVPQTPGPVPESTPEPEPVVEEQPPRTPEPLPETTPEPEPAVVEKAQPVAVAPAEIPVQVEASPPDPVPVPEPDPVPEVQPEQEAVTTDFQVFGTLQGAAASQVESVLILGPNNILREAARVRPGRDGRWGIDSLPPGRYRIVLDAGGGNAIVSEPRFATIQVVEGEALEVPPFEAQQVR